MKEITYNKWEDLMFEYLAFASLRVEPNENQTEDFPNKYWLMDNELTWDSCPIESAADVFEGHPSIVNELLDDLDEEAREYNLDIPDSLLDEDGKWYGRWEAGYWALLLDKAETYGLEYFVESHRWKMEICSLMAFHVEEVDLEKFV